MDGGLAVPTPAVAMAAGQPNLLPAVGDCSLSSSPRQFPTDLTSPILEEGDESESDIREPVTPESRQSQDFSLQNPSLLSSSTDHPSTNGATAHPKVSLVLNTATPPPPAETSPLEPRTADQSTAATPVPQQAPASAISENPSSPTPSQPPSATPSRRNSRNPLPFGRRSFSFFRRSNSQTDRPAVGLSEPNSALGSEINLPDGPPTRQPTLQPQTSNPQQPTRRWSMNRSSTTTRSNSPPSPPLTEMASAKDRAATSMLPSAANGDGMEMGVVRKKVRSSTGLSLRSRAVNFVTSGNGHNNNGNGNGNGNNVKPKPADANKRPKPPRRRASSFDLNNKPVSQANGTPVQAQGTATPVMAELLRQPWAMPADMGTGMKARRLSVSLPDDFTVDVAELQAEFEYQSKFLGRHGKHLGKGATSKVTLMSRKGCPTEMYAVKEFRGKTSAEKAEEYENKVKSEFSIAKSLHHPNIVETIRLCTDHGRWNHVMEYCSEGDLYGLVEKKYLREESRQTDRLCFFKQLVQGINYLHSNGIAHRDIKLENLLITKDSKLKITDFGVSEVFSGIHPGLREAGGQCGKNMGEVRLCQPGMCGSMPYVSPEVLAKDAPYDPRALDVWGAAVVAINLFFGAPLWKEARDDGANPQYSALKKGWDRWNKKHPEQFLPMQDQQQPPPQEQNGNTVNGSGNGSIVNGSGNGPTVDVNVNGNSISSSGLLTPPESETASQMTATKTSMVPTLTDLDYPYVAAVDFGVKPPALKKLLLLMLNPDPARRISISGVINNRWLKNVECCQLESYDDPSTLIDASKKSCFGTARTGKKIFCHNHLPVVSHGHSLGKMPGQVGY